MTHMGSSLIVEARGFGAAQIAAFKWNEYILIPVESWKKYILILHE